MESGRSKVAPEDHIVDGGMMISKNIPVNIPRDMLFCILSRVPVKSLVRCKCVCKSWYYLLTHDTDFITMHLNRSIENRQYHCLIDLGDIYCMDYFRNRFPEMQAHQEDLSFLFESEFSKKRHVTIIHDGSCNGLFLISGSCRGHGPKVLYLWNPGTREYKRLPSELTEAPVVQNRCPWLLFGLRYDPRTSDYKVISRLFYNKSTRSPFHADSCFHVYSLRTNSVKKVQGIPLVIQYINRFKNNGIFLKDSVHWLFGESTKVFEIVLFDATKKEYKQLQMPDMITKHTSEIADLQIGVLNGCICLYRIDRKGNMDVIAMKVPMVKESWIKLYTLTFNGKLCGQFNALFFNKNEEAVLYLDSLSSMNRLVVYKLEEKGDVKYVPIHGLPRIWLYCNFEPYVESLVSLNPTFNFGE